MRGYIILLITLGLFSNVCSFARQSTIPNKEELSKLLPAATLNKAERYRIIDVMRRAIEGGDFVVAAIGGSITAGANATEYRNNAYFPLVHKWWASKFLNAKFKYVNAGIGATSSVYGVHRAQRDLLHFNPDFTIVDFTVNDNGIRKECAESYEGLLRKILINNPKSALLSIAMVDKKMENVEDVHVAVCENYQIPLLSVKQIIEPMIKSGRFTWSDWSRDDVHPNDNGHKMIAELIICYLEECYKEALAGAKPSKTTKIAKPITQNGYQNSNVYDASNFQVTNLGSWSISDEKGYWANSWSTTSSGEPMTLEIEAKSLIMGFRRDVNPISGRLIVKVDGKQIKEIDPNFVKGWGSFVANETLFKEERAKKHTVEFIYNGGQGAPILIKYLLIAK